MEKELIKTELLSVEAYRDDSYWQCNSWHSLEKGIYLHPDTLFNARALLKYCRDHLQIVTQSSKGKLQIEDDGYSVQIQARNGEPLFAFCYGENY
mgnify:CR=1 FL=1|tara:strand:+ start:2052 stop:2336 length:285 start_codon:yes stop_codon:yes gene_type:complete